MRHQIRVAGPTRRSKLHVAEKRAAVPRQAALITRCSDTPAPALDAIGYLLTVPRSRRCSRH